MAGASAITGIAAPLVFYPRAFVSLRIRLNSTSANASDASRDLETGIIPDSLEWVIPPHHQAQTCEATIKASALPFEPRAIAGISITAFMGAVNKVDADVRQLKYLRFTGYVDEIDDEFDERGLLVKLKARDLSAVMRDIKPLPVKATPRYSDTLQQAIQRIMIACGIATDELDVDDGGTGLASRTLSQAVGKRAQSGYVPLKRAVSAWEAIEHACGIVNVLVSVELGKIRLRQPSDAFGGDKGILQSGDVSDTSQSEYTFVFGEEGSNLLKIHYHKKFLRNRNGVRCVSFDPTTRRPVVADWPPDSQLPQKKRPKLGSHKADHSRATNEVQPPPRDVYSISDGVHTQDALLKVAKRIYSERARQEMEGDGTTPVWDDDLFKLRNGSRITVKITPRLEAEVRNSKNTERAVELLRQRLQVDDGTARAIVNISKNREASLFYARTIHHQWSMDRAQTKVDFINLVEI